MSCMSNQVGINGYSYSSDHPSSSNHQNIQSSTHFLNQFEPNPSEIYNMNPNMEMMIGFLNPTNLIDSYQQNQMDDPSDLMMRSSSCVLFPCEANERPSQGLSLSLSSSNPSTIGLQSFELRQQDDLRFGPSSSNIVQQGQIVKYSKYLGPAQELLNEFCNLGINENDLKMKKVQKNCNEWLNNENAIKKSSFFTLDLLELQRRKTKLLHMLEEVDRRYRHYCDQMKSVVSSFEAIAGNGAATVYSALASKAMSRHFRCLRDEILSQIKATKIAIGEKDSVTPGASKGETPRLRVLDQTLRQQRAFQKMRMMETHPWRPQRGLPERSVSVLRAWLFEHFLHPYPSDVDKHILARQTSLSRSQVSNWFINARVRLWKPMVEEMYMEELKDQEGPLGLIDRTTADLLDENYEFLNQNPRNEDQKPTHDQLIRIDSECLSSIINNPDKINHSSKKIVGDSLFGAMELDFSAGGAAIYGGGGNFIGGGSGGGGGVSLTLGLHQNGGNLAFSPASQGSLFQYSMLDSESQTLPYRNLMDAQLLHDLAG